MEATQSSRDQGERVDFGRLLWVGPLAIAAAVVANVLVRTVAVVLFDVSPGFPALALGPTVVFTVVGVLGAVLVFALVARFARRPVRLFRRIALVVLLVSFVPNVLLLLSDSVAGATVPAVGTLMFEHVVAWAVSVGILTTLALAR